MIVFDVDGTILPGTSCERLFVRFLMRRRILPPWSSINFGLRGLSLLRYGLPYVTKANKGYLRGFPSGYMADIGKDFFPREAASRISGQAIKRIGEHKSRGERVILFSGMPDFLLENFASFLGVEERYGSVMEIADGRFTGLTLGPFPLGQGKVIALERIIAGKAAPLPGDYDLLPKTNKSTLPIDWSGITFYGDHWLDRFLFSKVGRPVVVNAKDKLLQMARENGWECETFS